MYIDLIINTERAQHNFTDKKERHEIFDVYMKVPSTSIRLHEIKDLFYPNKDTKESCPRTILVVGRPGIGKTVLSEKIIRDWANEVDEFYTSKVVVFLKFRWFKFEELKTLSLKMFLRYGTGLGKEEFEIIFDTIISEPERFLLIFDGLDEFSGNFQRCFEESRIFSNDPNTSMPRMTLFIKLVSGNMLDGATVLVTSRPTADNFYSKMRFERKVEILGFTKDKIKEYVIRFCQNIGKHEFELQILNHIESSSDLSNLCYIPVNCYIVCATLSGCLSRLDNDIADDTDPLPTTLTELYRAAVNHFEKNHDRISDEETTMGLQKLAFDGMEKGQLVFNELDFNDSMKNSGLVNSSSNPFYSGQTQFCFIHLTIQEFLAARHITETRTSNEIAQFISFPIKEGKWHLVLQFIAGLVSKKFNKDCHHCVFALTKALTLCDDGMFLLTNDNMLVAKWLREVNDEKIIIKACAETELNLVTTIACEMRRSAEIPASDWKAVVFVFQHLKKLKQICVGLFYPKTNTFHAMPKLLKQHCLEKLYLDISGDECGIRQVVNALSNSKCQVDHDHFKLTDLAIKYSFDDECMSSLCTLIKNGHASRLKRLLLFLDIPYGISQLCKVLNEVPCRELTCLELRTSVNKMSNEEVRMLCDALIRGHHNLEQLTLSGFISTTETMFFLNEVLCDERCKVRKLVLKFNINKGDEGVYKLCTGALVQEQCELTCLDLSYCSLTVNCIFAVCNALIDNHCKLSNLDLRCNIIGDDGVKMLCTNALKQKQCKLAKLKLDECGLTDNCVRCLYDTLKNGNCSLVSLSLFSNRFSEDNKRKLRDCSDINILL